MSRKIRTTDRRAEITRLARETSPMGVSSEYQHGRTPLAIAVQRFERSGSVKGLLDAAELCLEQAFKEDGLEKTGEWLGRGKHNLERIVHNNVAAETPVKHETVRALLHLAQLPNTQHLALTNAIPPVRKAEGAYQQTVKVMHSLTPAFQRQRQNSARHSDVAFQAGTFAEASVLLLGQRHALREMGDQSWFPMMAWHSQDHANTHGTTINRGWDVSVYTDIDGVENPTYRIQVKSSDQATTHHERHAQTIPGISFIVLRDALSLSKTDRQHFSVTKVIAELACEAEGNDPRVTERLDARTNLLLDALDDTA